MKKNMALIIFTALLFTAFAAETAPAEITRKPAKSIFSMDVGFVTDGHGGQGYAGSIKSATFLNNGPFYYGFSSLFGNFVTTKEAFFETGLLMGYNRILGSSGLDMNLFLDLLAFGGRIDQESQTYRGEAPALHMGLALGFPADGNIDGTISIAPVIRPYNRKTGAWDFSRSYMIFSVSVRFKSFALVELHNWSESLTTKTREENL